MASDLGGRTARRQSQRRRRIVMIATVLGSVLAIALVVGGIVLLTRSDSPNTKSTASRRHATSTSSSSTTSSTTLPVVTTVVPKASNPVVALAQQYDGYYVGTFSNTTFGTTGPSTLEIRIDPAANTLMSKVTFDGDLFGGGAKSVREISSTVKIDDPNGVITVPNTAFGTVTAHIDSTLALVVEAKDVPDPKVATFTLTGRLNAARNGFDATYAVGFEDGKTAAGMVTVACAPDHQRTNAVQTLCPAM
jgi:hypothetical protein